MVKGYFIFECALNGKILLVRIIENNKIDAYFGQVRLSKNSSPPKIYFH